jgi:GNAT superfamily N-acetyltransferase
MIKIISFYEFYNLQQDNELIAKYAEESAIDELNNHGVDCAKYEALEDAKSLDVIGYFDDNKLAGFIIMLYTKAPHMSNLLGILDSFYVLPEYRKFGAGKKLVSYAESLGKSKGIEAMILTAPIGSRLEKVAGSFGYKPTNIIYTKDLK